MQAAARLSRSSACSSASAARPSLRAQRPSSTATKAFEGLKKAIGLGGEPKKEGKNDGILGWARNAKMGTQMAPATAPEGQELATFAGGCFWGLELQMQRVPGVVATSVGYTGGSVESPSYEAVCTGRTGHTEAVQVTYDPKAATFESLLDAFAAKTDLTTLNRQGNDRGTQYRSGVYYHSDEQKAVAERAFERYAEEAGKRGWSGKSIAAELKPAGDYWLAEEYHQQYLEKGGRFSAPQSAAKGCNDKIRCYG